MKGLIVLLKNNWPNLTKLEVKKCSSWHAFLIFFHNVATFVITVDITGLESPTAPCRRNAYFENLLLCDFCYITFKLLLTNKVNKNTKKCP